MIEKLTSLKQKIETHMELLQERQPISPLIVQSIDILFDMKASNEEMRAWYAVQRKFIRAIEKEVMKIESCSLTPSALKVEVV